MTKSILMLSAAALVLGACATVDEPTATPSPQASTQSSTSAEVKPAATEQVVEIVEAPPILPQPKYEPLVYGAEKPLICKTPVLAEGKLKDRPNLQVMWENYLYDRPEGIWSEIGGMVEVNGNLPFDQGQWTNACTVRLSHMLNKADHKIPRETGNKTVSGGNKDQYYYRLSDMESYLIDTFGAPDLNLDDGHANSFDLPETPGIVLMDFPDNSYTGHTTIWNGAGTVDGAEIGGYRVLFWHMPCFIPADRNSVVENAGTTAEHASP